jgi:pyruvate/2-oxoglutarate dehydrogenase complex dihydrolipoamide dehydrogenase (E3) component
MNRVARAVELNESGGLMKIIVDSGTQCILGAAVLGVDSREIIAIFQIAMMADMPYTALRDSMFAHPTLVGSLDNLFAALHH